MPKKLTQNEKIDAIYERLNSLADFDEKTEKIVEEKVFELRAIAYLTLVVASVLLFLALGVILKNIGF
ncbi:hypothetical protein COU36_03790 [Candidatus Micrarchaeota archaeon CG10_big_fil_rev_8_21_14_0_10_59_7]|nr:MAG: hypothetical protein COU36_03790 [Candidatus Micrarchaeota archaeon CG10_big_fil_rev_8_21_14_0_10_59_7]